MGNICVDVAIIGAGAAGLVSALTADAEYKVGIFCKRPLGKAASSWAQGGIAAAKKTPDSPEAHCHDTLIAGDGLCNKESVRFNVEAAPEAIDWLATLGVDFNTDKYGELALTHEGGHQHRRISHVDDYTGLTVMQKLLQKLQKKDNVTIFENYIAVDLIVQNNRCVGFYALNINTQKVETVQAGAVILATGGAARMYLYASTPRDTTGDGISMAYRAGCRISNMEFVQFHPTTLFHPQPPPMLISETLRGEGALLINHQGERFVAKAHPDAELASRDIVARAIDREMKITGKQCVFLDCSQKPNHFWESKFPSIIQECRRRGLWDKEKTIPVVPAAHYCCGGVHTDVYGKTDINGLYAIGETANSGLHGANRLASNSLLECVVSGRAVMTQLAGQQFDSHVSVAHWDDNRISASKESIMISHNWEELRRIMWNYVGIVRNDLRLRRARRRIGWIQEEVNEFYAHHPVSRDFIELRNLAQCALLVIEGAMQRRESRGLHFNLDCPDKNTQPRDTILCRKDFHARQNAINEFCPFSNMPITAGATTVYKDSIVGFCNPSCRNDFVNAVLSGFANASDVVLKARHGFDQLIDGLSY